MADKQTKLAATLQAGRKLRSGSSFSPAPLRLSGLSSTPAERSGGSGIPVSSTPDLSVPVSSIMTAATTASSTAVSLPYIPTNCTPERPGQAVEIELHPSPHAENFESPQRTSRRLLSSVVKPAARGRRSSPDRSELSALQDRIRSLESKLRERSRSPLRREHSRRSDRRRHHSPARRYGSPVRDTVSRSVRYRVPTRSPSPADSQASVFSRLGPMRAASMSPEPADHDQNDISWSTIVDLGMVLAGHHEAQPAESASGTGLLAKGASKDKPRLSFPPSSGVVQSLQQAFDRFSGGHELNEVPPSQMPGDVTTKIPVGKFGQGFKHKFHGGEDFPMSVKSLTPTPDELSFLGGKDEPAVPVKQVADLEFLMRKNVRVLSSLDWLLNTLQEVYNLPNHDPAVLEALWGHIRRCLQYSTDFSSGALISSIIMRRESFVRACDPAKVPKRTHAWATLRPPFSSNSTALLGDAAATLRSSAREDREMSLMSSLAARQSNSSRQDSRRTTSYRDNSETSRFSRPNRGRGSFRGRQNFRSNRDGQSSKSTKSNDKSTTKSQ